MHAVLHIVSRRVLSDMDIEEIMEPYYEGNIFTSDDPPDPRPAFHWDYYTVWDLANTNNVIDCYILIDPDGFVIAREWFDGDKWVDQRQMFDEYVRDHQASWKGYYIYELDIHW